MFLHGGWMHLIGNMWFLWIYGDNVEDVLGHGKYLMFYLLCGIAAGLVHVFFNSRLARSHRRRQRRHRRRHGRVTWSSSRTRASSRSCPIFMFFTTVEIPACIMLLYWFVIQFSAASASSPAQHGDQGGVAWFAHVGGFVAGLVLIKILPTHERYRLHRELRW